jgi:hemolysin III
MSDLMPGTREAKIDQILHLIGIAAALVGSIVLLHSISMPRGAQLAIPVGLYLVGVFAMLFCSAFYNASEQSSWRPLFRRLDHAAIFLLIAGTYSPFLGGTTDNGLIAITYAGIWIVAIAGVLAKLLFHSRFQGALSITLYLALGWSVLLIIGPVSAIVPFNVLMLLLLGGVLYTIGVGFHLLEQIPYQNAIWHGLVITAASVHFLAVLAFVRP